MVTRSLVAFAAIAMFVGMSPATAEDFSKAVEAAYRSWDSAFDGKDVSALGRVYTQDALFLAPDHEIRKGPKAIEAFFDGLFRSGVTGHQISLIQAGGEGRMIYGTARWKALVNGEDGKPKEIGGVATHVFERQDDGSLKLKVHSFN